MAQVKIRSGILEMEASGSVEQITKEMDAFSTYLGSENGIKAMAAFRGALLPTLGAEAEASLGYVVPIKMWSRSGNTISIQELKEAIKSGRGPEVIHPFDELEIPLDTGGIVTVQCGYVDDHMARFVFKDCCGEYVMNDEPTNKTGYFKSKGRRIVLEDIYPHLPKWLRDVIVPRQLSEVIDGEKVEYADPLWLPSATDLFGSPEDKWWPDEPDSFQLPIFLKERDRVKECGDHGTYFWWLRSVTATTAAVFCSVYAGGGASYRGAYLSRGFAPGFDL